MNDRPDARLNSLGFVPGTDVRVGMLDFGFDDTARTRPEAAVVDQLAEFVHNQATSGQPVLTKKFLFSSNCNEPPVISSIVNAALVTLREARDIRILGRDSAVRRSATQFGWDDRIELVQSQPSHSSDGGQPER